MTIDVLSLILKGLSLIALFQSAGMALFLGLFGEAIDARCGQCTQHIKHISHRTALIGIALLALYQIFAGARMLGELSGILDITMQLRALQPSSGVALITSLIGLLLITLAGRQSGSRHNTITSVGITLVIVSFTITGHSSVHPSRWLMMPLLLIHLWAVAFWFGSLQPLRLLTTHDSKIAASIVAQFSRIASCLVPCIAIAGILMALLLVPDNDVLLQPYGLLLLTKIITFAVLMGFAAINKWRLGPALLAGNTSAIARFQLSILIEYGLICLVLIITAAMTGWFSPEF